MATQAKPFDYEAMGEAKPARYQLPPVPNQDIYFYRKPIDNSAVVRQSDPRASARCWRWIATATAVTFVLAGLLWPGAYGMLAGSQIEALKVGQQELRAELASLEVEEASLLSPEKLDEMAHEQELIDPAAEQLVQLPPLPDGSLARQLPTK